MPTPHTLIDKINALSVERLHEVKDFVDFLRSRDQERALLRAASAASAPAFVSVWSNPEDDVYDAPLSSATSSLSRSRSPLR